LSNELWSPTPVPVNTKIRRRYSPAAGRVAKCVPRPLYYIFCRCPGVSSPRATTRRREGSHDSGRQREGRACTTKAPRRPSPPSPRPSQRRRKIPAPAAIGRRAFSTSFDWVAGGRGECSRPAAAADRNLSPICRRRPSLIRRRRPTLDAAVGRNLCRRRPSLIVS